MSHLVTVRMIADQYIYIEGKAINIHDIDTIRVDSDGRIRKVTKLRKVNNEPLSTHR